MIDIYLLLYGVVFLYLWSHFDMEQGKVNNALLTLPSALLIISLAYADLVKYWFFAFLIPYIVLYLLYKKAPGLIGFADVIAIPFTLFFVAQLTPLSTPIFALTLAFFIKIYHRMFPGEKGIKLISILFTSFVFAVIGHILLSYPSFFAGIGPVIQFVIFLLGMMIAAKILSKVFVKILRPYIGKK